MYWRNGISKGVIKVLGCFLITCVIMMSLSSFSVFAEETEGNRILFISSYSPSFQTFFLQVEGIRLELDNGRNVIDIEFMDTKRLLTEENLNLFYSTIKYKLGELSPYDVVIVSDDNGLNFVMEHKEELFPEIPIIFMGINNVENAKKYSEDPLVTGVVEAASIGDTIGLAYGLNRGAQRVVALVDSTASGQGDLVSYYELEGEFWPLEFTDLDLTHMSYEEFAYELSNLSDTDIVLHLSAYRDKNDTVMTFNDSLEYILKYLKQPLYHPYYHGVGDGMLGGRVISHYEQGKQAGKMANRVLAGESASSIPVLFDSPNPYLVDHEVLSNFELNESLLPEKTEFINKDETILEKYLGPILTVVIVTSLQFIIILALIINIRARKKAEDENLRHKAKLMDMHKS